MPLSPTYSVGTATVSAGSAIVTGTGTLWLGEGLRLGDIFERDGLSITILSVEANGSLTLVKPWPGASGTGEYEVRYTPDARRVMASARDAILEFEQVKAPPYTPFASYAEGSAATKPISLRRAAAVVSGRLTEWIPNAGSTLLGGGWTAAGEATPDHAGGNFNEAFAAFANLRVDQQYSTAGRVITGKRLYGRGRLMRSAAGNLFTSSAASGVQVSGLEIDMRRAILGNVTGHAFSLAGDDIQISDMTIRDFGGDGVGGGSGVLIVGTSEAVKAQRPRMDNVRLFADPGASSFGWIFANTDYGLISRIYAQDVLNTGTAAAYAHELKNNARFNSLNQLIAKTSQVAVAYGQDTAGLDGSDYNVATNILSDACDVGILVGEGFGNVFSGIVYQGDGATGAQKYGVRLSSADMNVVSDMATFGTINASARLEGARNVIRVAAHDTAPNIVEFRTGALRNFVEVMHPGTRLTIEGAYSDSVGGGLKGGNANVIHCPVTGEWFGSISGAFKHKLGSSGVSFLSSHRFRFEDDTAVIIAGATPTASPFGIAHSTPARANTGYLTHISNATAGNEYWEMQTGGAAMLRFYQSIMRPTTDGNYDLGASSFRYRNIYATTGVITTSDEREKTAIAPITDEALDAWGTVSVQSFRWREAVDSKGDAARTHVGLIAQDIQRAFEDAGLDATRYGLLTYDEWDGGDRWGVRMDECLWMEAAYQRRRLDRIEAQINEMGA